MALPPGVPQGARKLVITSLLTPACFWGHEEFDKCKSRDIEKLDLLEKEISRVYRNSKFGDEQHHIPVENELVAVLDPIRKTWVRGRVMKWNNKSHRGEVFLVDYGSHLSDVQLVRPLPSHAHEIKYQAVQVFLYGVLPLTGQYDHKHGRFNQTLDGRWVAAALRKVQDLLSESIGFYFTCCRCWGEALLGDLLIHRGDESRAISLAKALIDEKLAVYDYDRFNKEIDNIVGSLMLSSSRGEELRTVCMGAGTTFATIAQRYRDPAPPLKPPTKRQSSTSAGPRDAQCLHKTPPRENVQQLQGPNSSSHFTNDRQMQGSHRGGASNFQNRDRSGPKAPPMGRGERFEGRGSCVGQRYGGRAPPVSSEDEEVRRLTMGRDNQRNELKSPPRKVGQFNRDVDMASPPGQHSAKGQHSSSKQPGPYGDENVRRGPINSRSPPPQPHELPSRSRGENVSGISKLQVQERPSSMLTQLTGPNSQDAETVYKKPQPRVEGPPQKAYTAQTQSSGPATHQSGPGAVNIMQDATRPVPPAPSLEQMRVNSLTIQQKHMLPAIFRGQNVVSVGPADSGKTLGFVIPLASSMLDPSKYIELKDMFGPLVLILCANSERATLIDKWLRQLTRCDLKDYVYSYNKGYKNTKPRVKVLLTYGGGAEKEKLVLTNFDRLCHLVFDDADILFEKFNLQVSQILSLAQKGILCKERKGRHLETIVTTKRWTEALEQFTSRVLTNPTIIINTGLEVMAYSKVAPSLHVVDILDTRTDVLTDIVKSQKLPYKMVVACTFQYEVLDIHRSMQSRKQKEDSMLLLMAHEGINQLGLISIKEKWESNSNVVLLVSDTVLSEMNIFDASVLVLFSMTDQRSYFNTRMSTIIKKCPDRFGSLEVGTSKT
ncbi:hypothetical protein B566_EDAN009026 [Ephemera danica]|nr:hypothetical protein B566_EDAN009026 [Ephemera danica]